MLTKIYDLDENEIDLPTRWEICPTCQGEGKSSAYLGAFTAEDMYEEGPEFIEEYCRGDYDRACDACSGAGKIRVVDEERIPSDLRALYEEQMREEMDYQSMCRMERMMGA